MSAPRKSSVLLLGALIVVPAPAFANVGVPWLSTHVIYSILLLIPIIGIESYMLFRQVGVGVWTSLRTMIAANLASTILGVGVVFAVFLISPAMGPPDGTFTDTVNLLVLYPFYRLSVWVESKIGIKWLRAFDRNAVYLAIRLGNRFSYTLMAIFIITRIIKSRIVNGYFV